MCTCMLWNYKAIDLYDTAAILNSIVLEFSLPPPSSHKSIWRRYRKKGLFRNITWWYGVYPKFNYILSCCFLYIYITYIMWTSIIQVTSWLLAFALVSFILVGAGVSSTCKNKKMENSELHETYSESQYSNTEYEDHYVELPGVDLYVYRMKDRI
jgi:hypothetical protein